MTFKVTNAVDSVTNTKAFVSNVSTFLNLFAQLGNHSISFVSANFKVYIFLFSQYPLEKYVERISFQTSKIKSTEARVQNPKQESRRKVENVPLQKNVRRPILRIFTFNLQCEDKIF